MKHVGTKIREKASGIPIWKVILPISLILLALHILIISCIFVISGASNKVTSIMRVYSGYIGDISDLQGGSSYLSETSLAFLLHPVQENGEPNVSPLMGFADELNRPRRSSDILGRFSDRDIDEDAMEHIRIAAEASDKMLEIQLNAIALTLSVYPAPPIPALQSLPLPALSEEEAAMTEDERLTKAFQFTTGLELSALKRDVSTHVAQANGAFQAKMQTLSAAQIKEVGILRSMLWIATLTVAAVLLSCFLLIIRFMVYPMRVFSYGIENGTALKEGRGLAEIRLLARSYNDLLEKKTALENALRSAAETDALTDLPNRYCMEQYLLQQDEKGVPVAFFLFDVNFLKKTNDKEGHLAGDALLKRAAACISTCFEGFPDAKCFRYGGDEFATIFKNCRKEDIEKTLSRFEEEQKNRNVSLAIGYAYAPDISQTTMKVLFSEADKNMYEHKKQIHLQSPATD